MTVVEARVHNGVREGALKLAFLLYGAGGGLLTTLILALSRLGGRPEMAPAGDGMARSGFAAAVRRHSYPLVFLGAAAASAAFSTAPLLAWGSVALTAVMLLVFWTFSQEPMPPRRVRELARYWVWGSVLLAAFGLESFLENRVYANPFVIGKNGLGTLLSSSLPLAYLWLFEDGDRVGSTFSLLLVAGVLFCSMSEGGWVGAAAAQVLLMAFGSRRLRRTAAAFTAVAVALGATAAIYVSQARTPAYSMLMSRLSMGSSSKSERLVIWQGAWRMFEDHPWVGVGLGAFISAYPAYRLPEGREEKVSFAHNLPLNLLAETGVVGFAGFVLMVATWFRRGLSALAKAGAVDRDVVLAVIASLTALLVHQLFDGTMWSLQVGIGFWILGAMLCGLDRALSQTSGSR